MKNERTELEIKRGPDTAPWGTLCLVVYSFLVLLVGCTVKNELKNKSVVTLPKPPEVIVCRDTNGPIDWRTWDKK